MCDETTLLPCPFCGGEASKRLFYGTRYGVYCDECDARVGGLFNTEAEAITAWNTRAGAYCAYMQPTDLTDGCSALERIAELEEECAHLREAVDYWQRYV